MKKMLLAILSVLYLVSTSGTLLQSHYCMGKLRETSVSFHQNDKCNTCGMESGHSACCHDENQWFKVDDTHHAVYASSSLPSPFFLDLPPISYFFQQADLPASKIKLVKNHSPPLLLPDRNVLHCVFRI